MARPAPSFRPRCHQLEAREVPAVLLAESFDAVAAPGLPAGFRQWSASGTDPLVTSAAAQVDGRQALAATGNARADNRFWGSTPMPADAGVRVRALSSTPSPVSLIARGSSLDRSTPTYLAAVVTPGGRQLSLVEVRGGKVQFLGTVKRTGADFGLWFTLSLQPVGNSATVRLQRPDTGQYLNPQGTWQAAPVDAIKADTTLNTAGLVGVGRSPGGNGPAYFDALVVTSPPETPQGPPAGGVIRESFDAVPLNGIPAGWQEWASDGTAGFGASPARAVAGNGMTATGTSALAARTWLGSVQPADVQAAASVFADTLIPAGVVVRGRNLDTARPTFYALTVTRNAEVRLTATVDGVETALGSVRTAAYFSQKWLRLTLTAVGTELRAVVVRADTGQWLTPAGTWSDTPQPALAVADSRVAGGGFVGLTRSPRAAAGAVSFDDVQITPGASITGPAVTVTPSQPAGNVVGDLTLRASAPGARRIEFRLNGAVRSAATGDAADWTLDTTTLPNGPATVEVRAADDAANVGTATVTFTVNNPNPTPPPTRPDLTRKLPHVRVAQLAYSNTPFGDFERARLADSVDLVIPAPKFQADVQAASPDTQQLVYTNLSNLYGGLLTDWLAHADRTGVSRELAFYHVPAATPFRGGSPSSQPVNWLWQVARGTTDLTAEARGGRPAGVGFGAAAGEAVTLGYPERFRELNVTISTAGAGWRGEYEYVSAVDAAGAPTAWKRLPLLSDTTGGLTVGGQVLFDPPADWVPARVNGGEPLYTVRVRTTTAGTPPEARSILGRDYVNAFGTIAGVIPAFDAAADKDGDGYLTDAEYAGRKAGLDARFVYESRLFYPQYGQMRFVTNPAPAAVGRWAADYHVRVAAANPLADGFFVDNANGRVPFAGIPTLEPADNYADDSARLVAAVWKAVAPKVVFSNTAGGFADATPVTRASTGVLEEFALRPMDATWSAVQDAHNLVRSRLAADSPSPYVILDTHPGTSATTDPRVRTAALAYYYLVGDPDRTMLMFFGGLNPSAAWRDTWVPAVQTDIGRPLGDLSVFTTGGDPQNPALGYRVYRREYANAVVLYKPRSYTLGVGTGTAGDATATTHDLGGSYRPLNADGTLGPAVSSVTLRNGEGAILMKA